MYDPAHSGQETGYLKNTQRVLKKNYLEDKETIPNLYPWIDESDVAFAQFFQEVTKTPQSSLFIETIKAISSSTRDKETAKKYAQVFTPSDVALFTAYRSLRGIRDSKVFDPCVGHGSLLIAAGCYLAIQQGFRGEKLLKALYGYEIVSATREIALVKIIEGLSPWLSGITKQKASTILRKQILRGDFLLGKIPKNCVVIANPPYKEEKGKGNAWIPFVEKLLSSNKVVKLSLILPLSICSAKRTSFLRTLMMDKFKTILAFHHDTRPRPLFPNVEQRITILTAEREGDKKYVTTEYLSHSAKNRAVIWKAPSISLSYDLCQKTFPKLKHDDLPFFSNCSDTPKANSYVTI